MATKPLIAYGRKSSGEDAEQSRARQQAAVERWAAQHREPVTEMVFEAHVSGSKPWQERELGRVLERVGRGEAQGIVVEEQSRLTRGSQLQAAELWEALDRTGARLVCTAEGIDTAQGDQELNFGLRALLAREQWKQYQRRVEASKKHAVLERGVPVGFAPFGYRRERHQPLEVAEPAASAVRQAFALRASGGSIPDVVHLLDRLCPGGPTGKGSWVAATVKNMLANRTYLGEARGGGYSKPGAHPALVDEATFAACQALARQQPKRRPTRSRSLLGGIVYCGTCGHKMNAGPTAKGYRGYRCRRVHAKDEKPCKAPATAMQPALERLVDEATLKHLIGRRYRKPEALPADDAEGAELTARLAAAQHKRAPFEDPEYVAQLGLKAAKRALAKLDTEIDALEDQLAERLASRKGEPHWGWIEEVEESLIAAGGTPTGLASLYRYLMETDNPDDPQRRYVLRSLIERIEVKRPKPRTQPLAERVAITWRSKTP